MQEQEKISENFHGEIKECCWTYLLEIRFSDMRENILFKIIKIAFNWCLGQKKIVGGSKFGCWRTRESFR
jgi:hypothetical protein